MNYLSYLKDNKRIEEVDSKELDSIVLDYIENNYEEFEQYTNDENMAIGKVLWLYTNKLGGDIPEDIFLDNSIYYQALEEIEKIIKG